MLAQIVAVTIFILMFGMIIWDKIERQWVTLGCGAATLLLVFGACMRSMDAIKETLNLRSFFTVEFWYTAGEGGESSSGINWATILFIAGMMIMVEGMAKAGFFRWLCLTLARLVKYKVVSIFVTFMIISTVLAMFIDSITVILFLAAVTVELAQLLKFDPVPMILAEIFCANLGGSATMCGDPPNIIIGTSLGYSFSDFVCNTGVIAGIGMVVIIAFFYLTMRKELLAGQGSDSTLSVDSYPDPKDAITNKKHFLASSVIFLGAVLLLVTHAQTGLTVAFIGVVVSIVTLIAAGKDAWNLLKKLDYKTLLFFIGLFVVVGGLEQTGILEIIAGFIEYISGGNVYVMVAIILWISAAASALIDNIPFAATMIPVIRSIAATSGMNLQVLAWALAIGTDIGGSATPIGASANVVGLSVVGKAGHPVGWGRYCKHAVPATIIVLALATGYIWMRYC